MFRSAEEELILRKHKHRQLLKMFRDVLTRVSTLKQVKMHVDVSAHFQGDQFSFDITVFNLKGDNTSLSIYDFWEEKQSQKLIDSFISAIKTEDFRNVKEAKRRV